MALHDAVHGTVDIDIVIDWTPKALRKTETALNSLGLVSRLPLSADDVFAYRDEYVKNRNLVTWNFHNPADISQQVDVVITFDLRGRRRHSIPAGTGPLFLLTAEDLLSAFKAKARLAGTPYQTQIKALMKDWVVSQEMPQVTRNDD